jgi:O-methyltransferase domain/Dimerisation domain
MNKEIVQPTTNDLHELFRLIGAYRISQAIYVAAELGIADLLRSASRTADELAAATSTHADSLYRVLRVLAGTGLLWEIAPRVFALTRLGAGLRRDVPGSLGTIARVLLHKFQWEPWAHLLENVRTGQTAFERVHGKGLFEYLHEHPEQGSLFDAAMTDNTARDGVDIAKCYDFSRISMLVDVGGGQGLLIASILKTNPSLSGILFDLPEVIAGGAQVLHEAGVSDRCGIIPGSFFEAVPSGADAYLLRHIIHDWDDAHACLILQNCRNAAGPTGKVLVVERRVGSDHRTGLPVLGLDLEMMVNVGGKERTEMEFHDLFAEAGLQICRIFRPFGTAEHVIIEAVPKGS